MITRLTNREKLLLCILAIAAGAFLALMYIIQPSVEILLEAERQLEETKQMKNEMSSKINSLHTTQSDISEIYKDIESILESYLPIMENYEIEALITHILVRYSLEPIRLTIAGSPIPITTENPEHEPAGIAKAQVNVSTVGTLENLAELIGYTEQHKPIRIAAFAVGSDTGSTNISLDFEVLMHE
jgi:Tfp pilus assembly protein PilO